MLPRDWYALGQFSEISTAYVTPSLLTFGIAASRLYFVGKLNYDDGLGHQQWLPFCKIYAGTEWQDCQQIIIPTT